MIAMSVKRFNEQDFFSVLPEELSNFMRREINSLPFTGENYEEQYWLSYIWCLVKLVADLDPYMDLVEWPEANAKLLKIKAGINRLLLACPRMCGMRIEALLDFGIDVDRAQSGQEKKESKIPIERQPVLRSIPSATLPPKKLCNCRDQ